LEIPDQSNLDLDKNNLISESDKKSEGNDAATFNTLSNHDQTSNPDRNNLKIPDQSNLDLDKNNLISETDRESEQDDAVTFHKLTNLDQTSDSDRNNLKIPDQSTSDNTNNHTRSYLRGIKRKRVAPLRYWLNERYIFGYEEGKSLVLTCSLFIY
jgi:hypothetical protein